MSMDIEPAVPAPDNTTKGSVGIGCLIGFLCQIGFIVLGILAALRLNSMVLWSSWGVTQWFVLIPLILQQRGKGHSRTVQGLIITGSIGLLLSSACALAMRGR